MVPHRMATASPAMSRPSMSAFVVRSSDQRGQDQRTADAEDDGLRRISPEAAGDGGRRGDDQGEPGHLEQAQEEDIGEDPVPRGLVESAVDGQERGSVG